MTKFLANLFLIAAGISVQLGNYWFTYGLWPRSWGSFLLFSTLAVVLMGMNQILREEK